MRKLVEDAGGTLSGVFYCPHLPTEGCKCRKPGTGLITAIEDEFQTSAENAFFVGDSIKDLIAAKAGKCVPILVKTGKGNESLQQLPVELPDLIDELLVFENLLSAAKFIIQQEFSTL